MKPKDSIPAAYLRQWMVVNLPHPRVRMRFSVEGNDVILDHNYVQLTGESLERLVVTDGETPAEDLAAELSVLAALS